RPTFAASLGWGRGSSPADRLGTPYAPTSGVLDVPGRVGRTLVAPDVVTALGRDDLATHRVGIGSDAPGLIRLGVLIVVRGPSLSLSIDGDLLDVLPRVLTTPTVEGGALVASR